MQVASRKNGGKYGRNIKISVIFNKFKLIVADLQKNV